MVKRRKSKAVVVELEDRISTLPDNILYHILSYVPTKDVVHTCVLSRRWKYIWKGIHTFDFHEEYDGNLNSRIDFLNYVKKVLLHHDGSVINKFKFRTCKDDNDDDSDDMKPHIEALFSSILSRKIQQIDLSIGSPILYPPSFFSYESFTVMKLSGVNCSFRLPASVCFPSLKIMHLESITLASKKRVQLVSLSCPVLEELEFWCCRYCVRAIHVFVPELKRLKLVDYWAYIPHSSVAKIKIHAKYIDFFHVINNLPCAFSFCNLLSLNSATVDIHSSDFARDLVQSIQNVKELKLYHNTFEYLPCVKDLLAFSNLQTLTLNHVTSLTGKFLTELLCSVPQIRSFILNTMLHQSKDYDFTAVEIPNSFLSQLKSIEIRQFRGEENEFSLVEMFLKNVRTIEKMIIVPCSGLATNLKKQNEVMRRLLMLPRELTCVIDFSC